MVMVQVYLLDVLAVLLRSTMLNIMMYCYVAYHGCGAGVPAGCAGSAAE